jgi:CTP synthase
MFIHLTLVPYIRTAGEIKTKPTQHSVKELRSIGIQPDVLLCRAEQHLPGRRAPQDRAVHQRARERGHLRGGRRQHLPHPDAAARPGLDALVVEQFRLDVPEADLSEWQRVLDGFEHPRETVTIGMVGKYMDLTEAYKSCPRPWPTPACTPVPGSRSTTSTPRRSSATAPAA